MITINVFYWVEMLLKEGSVLFITIACLIVFLSLKKEIIAMMSRLNQLKLGDLEIKFKREMKEIEAKSIDIIHEIPNVDAVLPRQIVENFNTFNNLTNIQPNVAVLSAWRELELTALTLGSVKEIDIKGTSLHRASGIAALKNAQSAGLLSPDIVKLYEKTGEAVKPISKGELVCTPEDALAFCNNAKRLSGYLTSVL